MKSSVEKWKVVYRHMRKGLLAGLFLSVLSYAAPAYGESLQQQIDRHASGEILRIPAGKYAGNIEIHQPIHIEGDGQVQLEGEINILSNDVVIRGIQVTGEQGIIAKNVENLLIEQMIIEVARHPVFFDHVLDSEIRAVTIRGAANHYTKKSHGIALYKSSYIAIEKTDISSVQDAVYIENSDHVHLRENLLTSGRYGTHIMYGEKMVIENNHISDQITGIMAMMSNDIEIKNNLITHQNALNSTAITVYQTAAVDMLENEIRENTIALFVQQSESVNVLKNKFVSNVVVLKSILSNDVLVKQNNLYSNILTASSVNEGIELLSNEYDDYAGYDFEGEGYGDRAYIASSTFGKWVVKNEYYQYFIGTMATELLNRMDLIGVDETALIDERPAVMKNGQLEFSFSINHFMSGVVLLFILFIYWRRLR